MTERGLAPDWLALYVVDPGKVSGVGCGVFDLDGGAGVAEVFRAGIWETWEEDGDGDGLVAAAAIVGQYLDWRYSVEVEGWGGCGEGLIEYRLLIEDFALRSLHADLSPVWMTGCMVGLGWKIRDGSGWGGAEFVGAGSHKRSITDDRLRRWGLWVKGSAHRRDAMRLLLWGLKGSLARWSGAGEG